MAKRTTTRLEGVEELERKLGMMKDDLRAAALMEATEPGADVLLDAMRQGAPERTGRGKREISKAPAKQTSASRADWDVAPAGEGFYLIFHEIGTVNQPARPFMRPALDQSQRRIIAAVKKELAAQVLKVTL